MKRLPPNDRRALVLEAALTTAERSGYNRMTREGIAKRAGVSPSLVSLYLGTMPTLRHTVMREAVKREIVPIVATGLADGNREAHRAGPALRALAAAHLNAR